MRPIHLTLTLLAASLPALALAQAPAPDCSNASTTAAMLSCEQTRYTAADKSLQATYQHLLQAAPVSTRIKLKASQAAWLLYRKAESDYQADAAAGGTLAPVLRITTLADLTQARATDLQKSIHP